MAATYIDWPGLWDSRDYGAFRVHSREASIQWWPTIRGTRIHTSDGEEAIPVVQMFVNDPSIGCVLAWPKQVMPVLQPPLYCIPVLAVP